MITAYWNGFRVLELRDFSNSKWGKTVQIALDSELYPNLMWVDLDSIILREEK